MNTARGYGFASTASAVFLPAGGASAVAKAAARPAGAVSAEQRRKADMLKHFLAGIQSALGDLEADATPIAARKVKGAACR